MGEPLVCQLGHSKLNDLIGIIAIDIIIGKISFSSFSHNCLLANNSIIVGVIVIIVDIIYWNGSWWGRSIIGKVLLWQCLRREKGLRPLVIQVSKVKCSDR